MRQPVSFLAPLAIMAAFGLGCSPASVGGVDAAVDNRPSGSGGASVANSGGSQGSGSGGAVAGTGGASATGTGGRGVGTGGMATSTGGAPRGTGGSAGAGSGDDGKLFTDAGVAMASTGGRSGGVDASTSVDARPDGPPGNGQMATCSIPAVGLTAVFTQTGVDVTVVITATACPAGNHVIQIHNGFSCDSAATQGPVWGGRRGDGIGTFTCNAQMRGTLTYTRVGTDATTNWTVGDHNTTTDVTLHPMLLDSNCGTFF